MAEFRRGSQADFPRRCLVRLKIAADFVVQVYEADLIRRTWPTERSLDYPTPSYSRTRANY